MKINLNINGLDKSTDDNELIISAFQSMFEALATQINIPQETIEEIWLVDGETFGATIQQISPGEEYTNNENYIAVGKTIPLSKSPTTSSIVMVMNYVLPVLANFINSPYAEWVKLTG